MGIWVWYVCLMYIFGIYKNKLFLIFVFLTYKDGGGVVHVLGGQATDVVRPGGAGHHSNPVTSAGRTKF